MLHYVNIRVADLERSGAFYDSLLGPLGWRRQAENAAAIGWGFVKPVFFVSTDASPRPEYGHVSFPANSIPAVRASFEAGVEAGGEVESEPGATSLRGSESYSARLKDPDGHMIEITVAPE
jgi:catechol 2,3-dioxygenase-like lactoylglutathione lyase family enzyme